MPNDPQSSNGLPAWLQMSNDGETGTSPAQNDAETSSASSQHQQGAESPSASAPASENNSPNQSPHSQAFPAVPNTPDRSEPNPYTSQASFSSPGQAQFGQPPLVQPTAQQHQAAESAPQTAHPQHFPNPANPVDAGRHHQSATYDLKPPPALDQTNLVNPVRRAPRRGWRKMLYSVTGGHINAGDSSKELEQDALMEAIRRPLRGDYRIAVMSLKGGVGKTTTTVSLGGIFASVRHDRVIAIDANPDLGTLAQRAAVPGPATIRDLLQTEDYSKYASVRQYTTQAKSRLEVIGSERDPAISEAFSESDYRHAIDILQHHYNVILTDCGTGLMHSAMSGVLDLANSLVLVTSPALDGAQSAAATLDWLNLHGHEQLAANAVVVVSAAHPGQATIDLDQLVAHFKSRTRAVHVIPFDKHLSEGATVDLERIGPDTTRAYQELAAIVAEDFDKWHRHATS